jgi:chromate transporter
MTESQPSQPSFATALRYWLQLGLLSFGGPAGQIAMMQHDLVDRRRWIAQGDFLQALNFCMVLPGPEAQQLATYVGWRLHGIRGALAAGILFVLPGALVLYALSWVAAAHGDTHVVRAIFDGLKPVVIAIVLQALWRIGQRTLTSITTVALALIAFIAVGFLSVPFPAVILAAGFIGWRVLKPAATTTAETPPSPRRALRLSLVYLLLLIVPVGAVIVLAGTAPFLNLARFFTQAAFVTFGGAYAILPYVARVAVETFQWLTPEEMVNGLALAETTPGPLILVLQYVGFFAGWHHGGLRDATLGAAITTYATFLPSIFLILIGAPYVQWIASLRGVSAAMTGITAAVVGVIATLAWFLGKTVYLRPDGIDVFGVGATLVALGIALRWKVPVPWLVLAGAGLGLIRGM